MQKCQFLMGNFLCLKKFDIHEIQLQALDKRLEIAMPVILRALIFILSENWATSDMARCCHKGSRRMRSTLFALN